MRRERRAACGVATHTFNRDVAEVEALRKALGLSGAAFGLPGPPGILGHEATAGRRAQRSMGASAG